MGRGRSLSLDTRVGACGLIAQHRLPGGDPLATADQHSLFLNFIYFVYFCLFLAVLSLHCCAWTSSSCGEQGLLCYGVQASHYGVFSCGGAQVLEHAGFRSCGMWALENGSEVEA